MRNFGASDRMTKIMERFGLEDGQELEHPWLDKSVENAQKRVEQRNYQIRKRTLEFDDVMNKQREVVYGLRQDNHRHGDPARNDPRGHPRRDSHEGRGIPQGRRWRGAQLQGAPELGEHDFPRSASRRRRRRSRPGQPRRTASF